MISLGLRSFAGVGGGAVLGAAAALDAAVGLQADELGEVLAGDEAEVVVTHERGDLGETVAFEEDGDRREDEVEMLGVGDEGKEDEQGEGVGPPEEL